MDLAWVCASLISPAVLPMNSLLTPAFLPDHLALLAAWCRPFSASSARVFRLRTMIDQSSTASSSNLRLAWRRASRSMSGAPVVRLLLLLAVDRVLLPGRSHPLVETGVEGGDAAHLPQDVRLVTVMDLLGDLHVVGDVRAGVEDAVQLRGPAVRHVLES